MRRRIPGLALAFAAVACGSTRDAPPEPGPRPAGDPDPSGRIVIAPEVHEQLVAWMAEDVTLIGDVVEIDATRIPFMAQLAVESTRETDAAGQRLVERTEARDPVTGLAVLTLRNRSGFTTTIETLPRVRLGGGRQFIATDRLVFRLVPPGGAEQPVAFTATAKGRARLVGGSPVRRVAGESVPVRAAIVRGPAGYELRTAEGR